MQEDAKLKEQPQTEEEGAIPEDFPIVNTCGGGGGTSGLITRKEDGRKIIILERNKQKVQGSNIAENSMQGKTLDKIMIEDTSQTTKGSAMILKRLKKSII